jgi:hypothetical protein
MNHILSKKIALVLALGVSLSACTNSFSHYPSTTIDVIPVIYQFVLTERIEDTPAHANKQSKKKTASALKRELNNYLTSNKLLLINNKVKFYYQNPHGLALAQQAKNWLLKQGAGQEKLTLIKQTSVVNTTHSATKINTQNSNTNVNNMATPLLIEITSYQVQVPRCIGSSIGQLARTINNCAVAGARWQSMVNPEKMLPLRVTEQSFLPQNSSHKIKEHVVIN